MVDLTLDHWDRGAANIVATLVALVVLRYAFMMWNLFMPGPLVYAIVILYIVVMGLVLLGLSVSSVDLRPHGRVIAFVVITVLAGSFYVFYLAGIQMSIPGPDAQTFSIYSADLLLEGKNPYAASMAPAWDRYDSSTLSVTPKTDGTHVTSLSYPAGAVLAFVPQRLLGDGIDVGATTGLLAIATLVYMVVYTADEYAIAPVAVFMGQDIVLGSFLGLIDVLWLLPVLVAMRAWSRRELRGAAIAMGIACAMKQQPWFILPFLGIWLYNEADTYEEFAHDAVSTLSWGVGTFLLINLPFILWGPSAWLASVLTPLGAGGASLVNQGIGLTILTASGSLLLTKGFYVVILGLASIWSLILYAVYWERIKWMAWLAPAFLLFFHYRSLYSYFQFAVVIAFWAALIEWELMREDPALLPDRVRAVVQEVTADG